MAKLGSAHVNIRANLKPLRDGMKRAMKIVTNALRKISRTIIRATKYAAVGFAALSAATIKLAMDAQESENLFEVSMGNMAKATRLWSDTMAKALGLNAYEVRKFVSTFNVMLESMGIAGVKTAEMSRELVELAYDMASFYNLRPAEAFQKLQAGITGEIEPLKRLGIIINETAIKQYALQHNMGLTEKKTKDYTKESTKLLAKLKLLNMRHKDKLESLLKTSKTQSAYNRKLAIANEKYRQSIDNIREERQEIENASEVIKKQAVVLSETEKIQIRYNLVMEQTKKAQGDLQRTVTSTTNVFRSLLSTLTAVGISYGEQLLPIVTKVAVAMRDWLKENEDKIKEWGKVVAEKLQMAVKYFTELWDIVENKGWTAALKKLGADIKEALKLTFEYIKPHAQAIGQEIAKGFWIGIKGLGKQAISGAAVSPKIGMGAGMGIGAKIGAPGGAMGMLAGATVGAAAGLTPSLIRELSGAIKSLQAVIVSQARLREFENKVGGL